jgi:uncharacterized membrane protein YfcA
MEEMYLKLQSIKEHFRQRPHTQKLNNLEYILCKNGGILKKPILSLISLPINLFLGYRTYCRLPKYLSNIFLLIFIILMCIFVFDIIYNNVSSNKKIENKCLDIINKRIRNNWVWTIHTILSIIVGFILIYYGFISLFMNMKLNNCPNNMFSTFSKK